MHFSSVCAGCAIRAEYEQKQPFEVFTSKNIILYGLVRILSLVMGLSKEN